MTTTKAQPFHVFLRSCKLLSFPRLDYFLRKPLPPPPSLESNSEGGGGGGGGKCRNSEMKFTPVKDDVLFPSQLRGDRISNLLK